MQVSCAPTPNPVGRTLTNVGYYTLFVARLPFTIGVIETLHFVVDNIADGVICRFYRSRRARADRNQDDRQRRSHHYNMTDLRMVQLLRDLELNIGDGLSRVQVLGAGVGAVHDGVAPVQLHSIVKLLHALLGGTVACTQRYGTGA